MRFSSGCSGNERFCFGSEPARSQFEVEPELAFDALDELVVGLGRLLNDLFVGLARPVLKDREGVRAGRIAKLPAVAVNDVADQIADDRRRRRLGERGGEEGPATVWNAGKDCSPGAAALL